MLLLKSITFYLIAGLCEIGGCYLVWLWLKEDKSVWCGMLGSIILIVFGLSITWQPSSNFAKTCAAYGSVYIVLSLLWGMVFDNYIPNKYVFIGACICLLGASVIYFAPEQS